MADSSIVSSGARTPSSASYLRTTEKRGRGRPRSFLESAVGGTLDLPNFVAKCEPLCEFMGEVKYMDK